MNIEDWPIDKPKPYEQNARTLTDRAVDKLADSIREFGWRQPIVVDKRGVIIVGHTRLLAARQLELKTVPVHVATNLTAAEAKAYRLMDNRAADEASWDFDVLESEIAELEAMEARVNLTGFEASQIEMMRTPPAVTFREFDENAAADVKYLDCPACKHHFPR